MKSFFTPFILFLISSFLFPHLSFSDNSFVGSIKTIKGECMVITKETTRTAVAGERLLTGDILKTGPNGAMGVIFRDDTMLSLGPGSDLEIDEFVFSPSEGKLSMVTKMMKGTASYLSGKIVKLNPEGARMETPLATIGIRGTHFLVKVD